MTYTYARITGTLLLIIIFLSGCLYPDQERTKNQVPGQDQLASIQTAVEQFRKKTNGLVPIKTKDKDTPIFRKYLLDFSKLQEKHLITDIPGTAYENGGVYQYTLITPEKNPQVKLLDLRIARTIRKLNHQVTRYWDKHDYPPFGKRITGDVYKLNYKKLGYNKMPTVASPYSQKQLPIVMDSHGKLYVDYEMELTEALKKYDDNSFENGDDIRYLLAENTPFVPAYSLPYTTKKGKVIFLDKNK